MMHRDMLLLAERLVIAMETMSQDVKNMSAYVYDISCSVSYLVNKNKEKESNPVVACDDGDVPQSVTSAAAQQVSAESDYWGPYDQTDERLTLYIGDSEYGKNIFEATAPTSTDSRDNSDVLSSESNPILTGGIKIEEGTEVEVSGESLDVHNMYGAGRNSMRISNEIKSETHTYTQGEYQAYGLHPINQSIEQLMPCKSVATIELASRPVAREVQCLETSSNSVVNNECSVFMSRVPVRQSSVARTSRMESSKDATSMVFPTSDSEERSCKCSICGKVFNKSALLKIHARVHTGERPYKCKICGKAFSQKGNLNKHLSYHAGVKRFVCHDCGKRFSEKGKLIVHIRTHTGEKPYSCNICGKAFRERTTCNVHKRIHTGVTSYKYKV